MNLQHSKKNVTTPLSLPRSKLRPLFSEGPKSLCDISMVSTGTFVRGLLARARVLPLRNKDIFLPQTFGQRKHKQRGGEQFASKQLGSEFLSVIPPRQYPMHGLPDQGQTRRGVLYTDVCCWLIQSPRLHVEMEKGERRSGLHLCSKQENG